MPQKRLPNGSVINTMMTRSELNAWYKRHPEGGGAPLPARAILDGATSVTISPLPADSEPESQP